MVPLWGGQGLFFGGESKHVGGVLRESAPVSSEIDPIHSVHSVKLSAAQVSKSHALHDHSKTTHNGH